MCRARSPLEYFHASRLTLAVLIAVLLPGVPALFAGDFDPLGTVDLAGLDPVHSNPYGVAVHPTEPLIYVALSGEVAFPPDPPEDFNGSTVAEIDAGSLQVVRTFSVGLFPNEIAISPDGAELFATNSTSESVSRVDLITENVEELPLVDSMGNPVSYPSGIAVSPDGTQLWVTSNGGSTDGSNENLIVLDRATGAFSGSMEIAGGLGRFAVRGDGRVVLPVGFPGDVFPSAPEVRIYDTSSGLPWTLLATLTLSVDISDFPAPSDIVLSPDGSTAYVTVLGGSTEIFVIDVDGLTLQPGLTLPGTDFAQSGIGITADGATLLCTDFFAGQMRAIDLTTGGIVSTVPVGALPNAIGILGGRAWIPNEDDSTLSVVALPGSFLRGDANGSGTVDLADGVSILSYLFSSGTANCLKSDDVNDDGGIGIDDAIDLFQYLFTSGPPPAYPFPLPGGDLTDDGLSCNG